MFGQIDRCLRNAENTVEDSNQFMKQDGFFPVRKASCDLPENAQTGFPTNCHQMFPALRCNAVGCAES